MSKEPFDIVIVSAGKFGREVYSWIRHSIAAGQPWRIKGFLDRRPDALEGVHYNVPILSDVESYCPKPNDRIVIAVGEPLRKQQHATTLGSCGGQFVNVIHPTAVVGENVRLGYGVILAPYTALTCDISIGNFVTISSFSGAGHDSIIGDYCQICSHCSINGNAVLEEGAFLGAQVTVIPNARIGAWSYVGAGSVVLKRVNAREKVFGNPAVKIGTVEGEE
jgi:sugar O-acyltransferase (sialic acid O-acetyltransferase NeuD family)